MSLTVLQSPLAGVAPQAAREGHPVWAEIAPHFTPSEFENPHDMDVAFLRWIHKVRLRAGVPMRITSDARDPDGDTGADLSAHKKRPCRAVDGQVRGETVDGVYVPPSEVLARVYIAAVLEGGVRFGTYKSSKGLGDVWHIDAETHPENPSPRWWTKW
jgi:hypothetical protein